MLKIWLCIVNNYVHCVFFLVLFSAKPFIRSFIFFWRWRFCLKTSKEPSPSFVVIILTNKMPILECLYTIQKTFFFLFYKNMKTNWILNIFYTIKWTVWRIDKNYYSIIKMNYKSVKSWSCNGLYKANSI